MATYYDPTQNATLERPSTDSVLQSIANTNPEAADKAMDALGYTRTPAAPTIPVDSQSQNPVTIPSAPSTSPLATNASVPTPEQIATDVNQPSTAQQQQTGILGKLAGLLGNQSSLATQQYNQEQAAGIPGLAKTVNDLSVQLNGLNDQATALQLAATPGGTIDNTMQQNATGRGITAGGLAPLTAAELRKNQIQQAGIASQALTVKSALYAAQGNYSLAKDAADKAAQVLFDRSQQEINYQKALLDQLAPTLSREDQTRAAVLTAKLQDRQTQIQAQIQAKKDVNAQAILAMTNNPGNAAAQFAAQQALKLDPTDPQYQAKAAALLGQYQTNPLDNALKQSQITASNLQSQKLRQELALTQNSTVQVKGATGKPQVISADTYNQRNSTINLINQALGDKYFGFAVGGQRLNPLNALPGSGAAGVRSVLDAITGQVSLANRSQLKGSGSISDFESRTLEKAASTFNVNQSPDQARDALIQLRGALTTSNGGTATVLVTDKSGNSQTANADSQAINKMIEDGLTVKYQ